jgi:hypothetical protein
MSGSYMIFKADQAIASLMVLAVFSQTLNVSSYTLPLPMNGMSQLHPRQSKDNGILLLKSNWRLIKLRSTMLSSMTQLHTLQR